MRYPQPSTRGTKESGGQMLLWIQGKSSFCGERQQNELSFLSEWTQFSLSSTVIQTLLFRVPVLSIPQRPVVWGHQGSRGEGFVVVGLLLTTITAGSWCYLGWTHSVLGVGDLGTDTQPGIGALGSFPLILWVQIAMIHGQFLIYFFFLQKDDLRRKKKISSLRGRV